MNGIRQSKVINAEQDCSQDAKLALESADKEYCVENNASDHLLGWQDDEVDLVVFRCRD